MFNESCVGARCRVTAPSGTGIIRTSFAKCRRLSTFRWVGWEASLPSLNRVLSWITHIRRPKIRGRDSWRLG